MSRRDDTLGTPGRRGKGTVLIRCLACACVLLAACVFAADAQASYGQMRLDGIGLLLVVMLFVAYGILLDIALLLRIFRHPPVLAGGLVAGVGVIVLLFIALGSPVERTGYFNGSPGGTSLVVLVLLLAVFLPFILLAPLAQHLALRQGRRWSRWITAGMLAQLALLPGFMVLGYTEHHFWQQEYEAGFALGRETRTGKLEEIQERAGQYRERIWGTGWHYPWPMDTPGGSYPRATAGIAGLARGLDASPLIAADEPLPESDRAVLQALVDKHFLGYAIPNITTKMIWDALEPGNFSTRLAPRGLHEPGVVSEEVIPLLLDRLERHGEPRLCPGGDMMDNDRALLAELVMDRVRAYDEARAREERAAREEQAREREMSEAPWPFRFLWNGAGELGERFGAQDVPVPDWSNFPRRVEQLCRGT